MTGGLTRAPITAALVRGLVADQFPRWAGLPVVPVEPGGWDNRTFRLGRDMAVRLPSASAYAPQAGKEHRWLPRLAPLLPLEVPQSLALGAPGLGFPWPWSVRRWIEGETPGPLADPGRFAADLAAFLVALRCCPVEDGPAAGAQNFHRGAPPAVYAAEVRQALAMLGDAVDAQGAAQVWQAATASRWQGAPVWVHGDVAPGNLLLREGRLAAVIDWGSAGVGDPACDLVIAWTCLDDAGRARFGAGVGLDPATWARARGWALWKALLILSGRSSAPHPAEVPPAEVVTRVIREHRDGA